jgi:DNA-binding beta-propeller fold protein YncE
MSWKNKVQSSQQRLKVISKPRYIIQTQISEKLQLLKPVAVAVSPSDGKIAVADQDLCQVLLFDRKYKFIKVIGRPGADECEFNGPKGIGFSTDGEIIVADSGNNRIQVLSPSGEFVTMFGQQGKGVREFDDIVDIVVDTQNRIYVCDCGNNRIQVLDIRGRFVREFGCCGNKIGDVDHPQGVAVCPSTGNVILADTSNKRVQVCITTSHDKINT